MIEENITSAISRDQTIADLLSDRLGFAVRLASDGDRSNAGIATTEESTAVIEDVSPVQCVIRLRLPDGGVALWNTPPVAALASARHAETVVELYTVNQHTEQLQSEVDALATQVVNDFEELALIRSLALAMELPGSGVDTRDLVLRAVRPLAIGIGAVSIAAVFKDGDDIIAVPFWTADSVISDACLHNLIERHRDEAERQPVVRNRVPKSDLDLEAGLEEFVLVQCRSEGRLHGWLVACNRIDDAAEETSWAQHGFTTVQASLLETATNQLAAQLHNLRLLRQKEELFTDVVRALVNAVEARDPYTCGHSERVARFARCLAAANGEPSSVCDRIYLTGLLHDVGKIAIPDGVLQKPGQLDQDERAIIETHTDAGWRILHGLEALRDVLPGVLYHHEHYNGNGYPDGLAGESIPLDGRILAVCDAFDAMTSNRPYRRGMPIEKAVEILRSGSGTYWDPKLIEAFISHIDEIDCIRLEHRPREHAVRSAPLEGHPISDPISAVL